jgi:hypothetical protein
MWTLDDHSKVSGKNTSRKAILGLDAYFSFTPPPADKDKKKKSTL